MYPRLGTSAIEWIQEDVGVIFPDSLCFWAAYHSKSFWSKASNRKQWRFFPCFVFCCVCLDPFTKTIDLKRFVNIFLPIQLHKMPFWQCVLVIHTAFTLLQFCFRPWHLSIQAICNALVCSEMSQRLERQKIFLLHEWNVSA